MKNHDLYQVSCSYYCAGLVVIDGVVARAAPVLKWTIGANWAAVFYRLEVVQGKGVLHVRRDSW
jgi:hypothetical protein